MTLDAARELIVETKVNGEYDREARTYHPFWPDPPRLARVVEFHQSDISSYDEPTCMATFALVTFLDDGTFAEFGIDWIRVAAARASGGGKCPHGHDDRHTCNDCWRASWGSTPSPDAGVVIRHRHPPRTSSEG